MCITEYDEERTLRLTFEEGKEEGREEGRAEGILEEKKKTIRNMVKANIPFEDIAKFTDCTIEFVEMVVLEMNVA